MAGTSALLVDCCGLLSDKPPSEGPAERLSFQGINGSTWCGVNEERFGASKQIGSVDQFEWRMGQVVPYLLKVKFSTTPPVSEFIEMIG